MTRGYFGIGAYRPKTSTNLGTLWRSALELGASFMFTIEARCHKEDGSMAWQPSNTTQAQRHIPLYVYPTFKEFASVQPVGARLIGVEQCEKSRPLETFEHPDSAIYLLGAEDEGLPEFVWEYCTGGIVAIATARCLNVAVAGSILMYDRQLKQGGGLR